MLYPYVLAPRNDAPSPHAEHFETRSDVLLVMDDQNMQETHRPYFVHKGEPSDSVWGEILSTEAMVHGGWFEVAYQLARYRLGSPDADLFADGYGEDYERSAFGWRLGIDKPRLLRPTNLEWGFYGMWRQNYLAAHMKRDPEADGLFDKLCPPSIAWTWILDCYLEAYPMMTFNVVREHKLDNQIGLHICNRIIDKVTLNEETWKTSIKNTVRETPWCSSETDRSSIIRSTG